MDKLNLQTTGKLRSFLVDKLPMIADGSLSVERAAQITKMAAQINESFYSEIKIAEVQKMLSGKVESLGCLKIG